MIHLKQGTRKLHLALTVSTLAFCQFTAGAAAQSADADAGERPVQERKSFDTIVVTAQRRTELARDVPITLNAFSADQLDKAGVQSTLELTSQVPGLVVARTGLFTFPAMRGITTQITGPGADSNVALYLDGVYLPATMANTFDLPDVEQVEVLKGPQGTLFGRNATGGAIHVHTRDPEYEFGGKVSGAYASFNDASFKGYLSIPIIPEKLALGVTAMQRTSDGYYNDVRNGGRVGGVDSTLVRGKLLFEPTDNLKILASAYYSDREDGAHAYGQALNGNTVGRFDPQAVIPTRGYDVAANRPAVQLVENIGGSLKIDWALDAGTLTSITGYNKYEIDGVFDPDFSYQPNTIGFTYYPTSDEEQFSQEISFSSDLSGPLNFTVGTFYLDGKGGWSPLGIETPDFAIGITGEQTTEAAALFGELFVDLTERLSVIAGARYSWEERSFKSAIGALRVKSDVLNNIGTESWDSLTPRLSLIYALTSESNLYFTYSEGFKSGVFEVATTAIPADGSLPLVDPETIKAYEAGFKGRLTDTLDFNAAAFFYDYADVQVTAFRNVDGIPRAVIQNAASAEIRGGEIEANWAATSQLNLKAGVSVLDTEYTSFPDAAVQLPRMDANGVVLNNGNVPTSIDASGAEMVRAPKLTISSSASYAIPFEAGEINLSTTVYHSDDLTYDFAESIRQDAYTTVDARVGVAFDDTPVEISFFGKNLTDERIIGGTFVSEVSDGVSYLPPRTFGVQVNVDF